MDTTDQRHPGTVRISPGWAIPVPLIPDELLSSWLIRTALANGCDPLVLTGAIWPGWRAWSIDIDRNPGTESLTVLSAMSGVSLSALKVATLHPVARTIVGAEPPAKSQWPWLLTTGARNRNRNGGLQFCPACLAADERPYFRREWRYAWHVGCEKHRIQLLDRCPHCRAPIEPHRLDAEHQQITVCASCYQSLLDVPVQVLVEEQALAFQGQVDDVLRGNGLQVHGRPANISEWFDVVRYYESFLHRCLCTPHPALENFSRGLGIEAQPGIVAEIGRTQFEQMSVLARASMLSFIGRLMILPESDLVRRLMASAITRNGYCSARRWFPSVLEPISNHLPDKPRAVRKTRAPASTATGLPLPRPRWLVERMMKRLQRKLTRAALG